MIIDSEKNTRTEQFGFLTSNPGFEQVAYRLICNVIQSNATDKKYICTCHKSPNFMIAIFHVIKIQ